MTSQINTESGPYSDHARAEQLSHIADAISLGRPLAGVFLADQIKNTDDYHTWPMFGAHAAIAIGDMVDGRLKRKAMRMSSDIPDRPMLDDLTDKAYFYEIVPALRSHEHQAGNHISSWILGKVSEVNFVRDVPITALRVMASEKGIKVNAGGLGKAKTFIGNIGVGIMLSPPGKLKPVKAIALTLMAANALASAASGALYAKRFTREMRLKNIHNRRVY